MGNGWSGQMTTFAKEQKRSLPRRDGSGRRVLQPLGRLRPFWWITSETLLNRPTNAGLVDKYHNATRPTPHSACHRLSSVRPPRRCVPNAANVKLFGSLLKSAQDDSQSIRFNARSLNYSSPLLILANYEILKISRGVRFACRAEKCKPGL